MNCKDFNCCHEILKFILVVDYLTGEREDRWTKRTSGPSQTRLKSC